MKCFVSLQVSEFRDAMTKLGDKLSEEEVDEMVAAADNGKGFVDCVAFAKILTGN